MDFRHHCNYLFTLLLVAIVIGHPVNFSSNRSFHERHKRDAVETSSCKHKIEKNGMSLFNYGIDKLTMGTVNPKGDFFGSLKSVYDFIQANRKAAKMRIGNGLQRSFKNSYYSLLKKATNINKLESALVFMYTENNIYGDLNTALRQHNCTHKALTQKDQDKAAYATALLTTLLYWKSLPEYNKTTYRVFGGVTNITEALKKYELGSSIVFPAFSSSSDSPLLQFANSYGNILLKIDNSEPSFWTPNDIAKHSAYPGENELLYPSLAEFRVMSKPMRKTIGGTVYYEIHLQLQGRKLNASEITNDNATTKITKDAAASELTKGDAASEITKDDASPVQLIGRLQLILILIALVYL